MDLGLLLVASVACSKQVNGAPRFLDMTRERFPPEFPSHKPEHEKIDKFSENLIETFMEFSEPHENNSKTRNDNQAGPDYFSFDVMYENNLRTTPLKHYLSFNSCDETTLPHYFDFIMRKEKEQTVEPKPTSRINYDSPMTRKLPSFFDFLIGDPKIPRFPVYGFHYGNGSDFDKLFSKLSTPFGAKNSNNIDRFDTTFSNDEIERFATPFQDSATQTSTPNEDNVSTLSCFKMFIETLSIQPDKVLHLLSEESLEENESIPEKFDFKLPKDSDGLEDLYGNRIPTTEPNHNTFELYPITPFYRWGY